MPGRYDAKLLHLCTPDAVKEKYTKYKRAKLDRMHAPKVPTMADWRIAQGASLEEVLGLDDWEADFPAWDTAGLTWGSKKKEVRLVRIPIGADGITYQAFEKEIGRRAHEIAERIRTGTYLFYPFREIAVLKHPPEDGRRPTRKEVAGAIRRDEVRILSVASIRDAIAQAILADVISDEAEALFSELDERGPVSFAYRPGTSASDAACKVYRHMKGGYVHILEADLSKFFDSISRVALLRVCAELVDPAENPLTFSLLRRFVYVDRVHYLSYHWAQSESGRLLRETVFQIKRPEAYAGEPQRDRPQLYKREAGIPQGGVVSGLLANLYLHSFDRWVTRELSEQHPLRYVRYADDFVILTLSPEDVLAIYEAVHARLALSTQEGGYGLTMHPLVLDGKGSKTRYTDALSRPIKFVGFEISPQTLRVHPDNIARFMQKWQEAVESEVALREACPDARERLRRLVQERLRYKVIGYVEQQKCPRCGSIRPAYRSWIAFFCRVKDWRQIRALDKWMRKQVYLQFRDELPNLSRTDLTALGLPSLMRQYQRMRRLRRQRCPGCAQVSRLGQQQAPVPARMNDP